MKNKTFEIKNAVIWVITVIVSLTVIYFGNKVVTKDFEFFSGGDQIMVRAEVTEVTGQENSQMMIGDAAAVNSQLINFKCKIKEGDMKGEIVDASQIIDEMYAGSQYMKPAESGDDIMLIYYDGLAETGSQWQMNDYYRFDEIAILAAIFFGLLIIIGRWKGVNTLLSLAFTFCFVFFVFVPAIMRGYNAYIWAIITCVFTIVMTLLLINGTSRKTAATIAGCITGTVIAAITTCIMSEILQITGFIDTESYYLTMLNPEKPMDLTAVIFAAIVIGAMGAIMDIAMDISSSLYEISEHVPDISFRKLARSGMSIGRDVMGTMANTLVLAYIGSSLSGIMILMIHSASMTHLLNREVIIVELMQAVIGSLAILLTIPCTVVICGILYLRKKNAAPPVKEIEEDIPDFIDYEIK